MMLITVLVYAILFSSLTFASFVEKLPLVRTIFHLYENALIGNSEALDQIKVTKNIADKLAMDMLEHAKRHEYSLRSLELERPEKIRLRLEVIQRMAGIRLRCLPKLATLTIRLHFHRCLFEKLLSIQHSYCAPPFNDLTTIGRLRHEFDSIKKIVNLHLPVLGNRVVPPLNTYIVSNDHLQHFQSLLFYSSVVVIDSVDRQWEDLFDDFTAHFKDIRWLNLATLFKENLKDLRVPMLYEESEQVQKFSINWQSDLVFPGNRPIDAPKANDRLAVINNIIEYHIIADCRRMKMMKSKNVSGLPTSSSVTMRWSFYSSHNVVLKHFQWFCGVPPWIHTVMETHLTRIPIAKRLELKHRISVIGQHFCAHILNLTVYCDQRMVAAALGKRIPKLGTEGVEAEGHLILLMDRLLKTQSDSMTIRLYLQDVIKTLTQYYNTVYVLSVYGLWISVDHIEDYFERLTLFGKALSSPKASNFRDIKHRQLGVDALRALLVTGVTASSRWGLIENGPKVLALYHQMDRGC